MCVSRRERTSAISIASTAHTALSFIIGAANMKIRGEIHAFTLNSLRVRNDRRVISSSMCIKCFEQRRNFIRIGLATP